MKFNEASIPGCFVITPERHEDPRGYLAKTFLASEFEKNGVETHFVESFFSVSHINVLRGMHFQLPPHDQAKLVTCLNGDIFDVVVDLRKGSSMFGKAVEFSLKGESCEAVYVPRGCAHGFLTMSDTAIVHYLTTSEWHREYDTGVHWSSIEVDWPLFRDPIVSARDEHFLRLAEFESPFTFISKY